MISCGPKITQKTPEIARIYAMTHLCGWSRSTVPRFDWSNSLALSRNFSSAILDSIKHGWVHQGAVYFRRDLNYCGKSETTKWTIQATSHSYAWQNSYKVSWKMINTTTVRFYFYWNFNTYATNLKRLAYCKLFFFLYASVSRLSVNINVMSRLMNHWFKIYLSLYY